jgi:hypothetical protein
MTQREDIEQLIEQWRHGTPFDRAGVIMRIRWAEKSWVVAFCRVLSEKLDVSDMRREMRSLEIKLSESEP